MWPEVRAFNTVLVGACVMDEYLIGAGVMGIIERMFSDIAGVARRRGCASRLGPYGKTDSLQSP